MAHDVTVLYLFESVVPHTFSSATLAFGELVVLAGVKRVKHVVAIGRCGKTYYDIDNTTGKRTGVYAKIETRQMPHTGSSLGYLFSPLFLLVHGFRFLRHRSVGVIHAESCYLSGFAALLLGWIFNVPVVIEYHVTYEALLSERMRTIPYFLKAWVWNVVSHFTSSQATALCANSTIGAEFLKKRFPRQKIFWYNPAIQVPIIERPKRKPLTLSFIGRLYPDKGPIYLIEALSRIKKQLLEKKVRVFIAGDGPEKKRLEAMARATQLSMVQFLGTRDRFEILAQTDLLVNTTIVKAALEMVIVEAAAVGIPTICFGDKNFPETVVHGVTGKKVPYRMVRRLAIALSQALKMPAQLKRWGSGARALFKERYAVEVQRERVSRMYEAIGVWR